MQQLINNVYFTLIFDFNKHGIVAPLYQVINAPNYTDTPITFKSERKIYLNLKCFTSEQCLYQLAHEVTHTPFNIHNEPTQWIEELLATYYSYSCLHNYPDYLRDRLSPKRSNAPKSWADLTEYIRNNLTHLETNPYAVYNHEVYSTVISSAFFDYFPSNVDFWTLLKILSSSANSFSSQSSFTSIELISKCNSLFPESKTELRLLNGFLEST